MAISRGNDFVIIDREKFYKVVDKKKVTRKELAKAAGVSDVYFSDVKRRGGKCNEDVFNKACKYLHIKKSNYILESGLKIGKIEEKKPKKASVQAPKPIITQKIEEVESIIDKPLVINLKSKNEFQELIEVQKEIRDALRELVNELKYEPPKPKYELPKSNVKPKAYFVNKEETK